MKYRLTEAQLTKMVMEAVEDYMENNTNPAADEGLFDFVGKRVGQGIKNAAQNVAQKFTGAVNKGKEAYNKVKQEYGQYKDVEAQKNKYKELAKGYQEIIDVLKKYSSMFNQKQQANCNNLIRSLQSGLNAYRNMVQGRKERMSDIARGNEQQQPTQQQTQPQPQQV